MEVLDAPASLPEEVPGIGGGALRQCLCAVLWDECMESADFLKKYHKARRSAAQQTGRGSGGVTNGPGF